MKASDYTPEARQRYCEEDPTVVSVVGGSASPCLCAASKIFATGYAKLKRLVH
jgi:hypothetical protein